MCPGHPSHLGMIMEYGICLAAATCSIMEARENTRHATPTSSQARKVHQIRRCLTSSQGEQEARRYTWGITSISNHHSYMHMASTLGREIRHDILLFYSAYHMKWKCCIGKQRRVKKTVRRRASNLHLVNYKKSLVTYLSFCEHCTLTVSLFQENLILLTLSRSVWRCSVSPNLKITQVTK